MDATPVSPSAAFISSASKSYGKLCCGRSSSPLPMGLKTKYKDSVFDRAFMSLFTRKIANVTGISGNINGYEDFVDVSREVMKGRNPAQQKEGVHKVLFSILPLGAPETEGDLHARCHKSSSVVDKERFKEVSFLPNELTEKISVLQATKQNEDKAIIPVGTASAAALALAVAGLISCSQAWAGPEIVSVQDAASWLGDLDDIKSGFLSAFLLIFFSEIGDKTFFIAAVLASRKSNAAVFTGTFGALVAMTFISVFLGRTFHYIDGILPFSLGENELPLDDLAAVILLVYFGISTLLEAASMEGSKAEEEQQEAELAIAGLGPNGEGSAITNTALATFGLVFVAEWGDKSFFSTVALSAASSPVGVVSGAVAGHGVATLLAVLGGSFLSSYISEKVTAYIGGSLFLVFAAFTLYEIVS